MRFLVVLVGVLTMAGQVLAQDVQFDTPSVVGVDKSTAMQWLYTAALLIGCLFVAFMPAKRSKLE